MAADQTPRPPATAEFGHVVPEGPAHTYPPGGPLRVKKVSVGPYDNNVYIVSSGNDAILIDGAASPGRLLAEVEGLRVGAIVQTHGHFDHVQALPALLDALGCPVYAHPGDSMGSETIPIGTGDAVTAGEVRLEALHTPGHTPGSICYLADGFLFSGDTLFPGGPGATDDDAMRFAQVMDSLDRLFALPDDTRVCPGHGLDTTIGRERPYLPEWRKRGW
jgi:glyoxylase-like metal-dependent hydrolase (beta-lactamase superfamily II)